MAAYWWLAQITWGNATDWGKSAIRWKGDYTAQWAEAGTMPVVKQFVGDFITSTGFEVHLRDMGTYNDTLLGNLLSDFAPLQSNDVLLVRLPVYGFPHTLPPLRTTQSHLVGCCCCVPVRRAVPCAYAWRGCWP